MTTQVRDNMSEAQNNARTSYMGITPDDLLQIIWRSRWVVLLIIVMAMGAGFTYINFATPVYTSTSRIYVQQSGPKILAEAEGIMTQSKNYLYTQAELLKSTPILSAALEENDIKNLKIFNKVKNPVAYLKKKGLDVTVGKKDDIIDISSESPDPIEAARLVNAVVDSYKKFYATRKRSTTGEILKILEKEKEDRDRELAKKLKAMMELKTGNIALAYEERSGNIVLDRLETLSAELTQAELQTVEAKSVYENFRSMMSDPARLKRYADGERARGTFISNADEWSKLETELEQLQMQLSDLSGLPAGNTPTMNALQMKVKQIENKLAFLYKTFAEAQLSVAEQQYESAKQKQEQIARYFEEQRRQAIQFNKQLADYTILKSDFDQTKKLCDILDDRIKEINITEDTGNLNISVLEAARPADKPSKPSKARYMAISLLLGLVMAGGFALIRDRMDQRLRSMEEITATTGLPALGVIPSMLRREGPAVRGKKAHLDSKSLWAETYRTMRTAVIFCATKAKSRTILVTSPEEADGKTTVVSNLAIAMAQAGQKTLVLEADFRKPMQSKIFGVNHNDMGLAGVLDGTNELKEVIKSTCVPGLDLLTCGQDVPNPSEVLHSDNFAKVMKLLAKQYDRIIVDSPPVLPVTDAQILASICQITILVLRAEKSTRKASRQACDVLLRVGARIPGVVVNDVPKNSRFGYYGVDGYYNDSNKTRSGRRTNGLQQSEIASKRQELCDRLGNSGSQKIVEIASPKKKTAAAGTKSAVAATTSDKTKSLNNSETISITEKQMRLPEENKAVKRHKVPAEAFDTT